MSLAKRPWSAALLAVLAAGWACGPAPAAAAPAEAKPNVLLVTVDDMSAESLGAFGCRLADTSPNIDRLARRGVRFNHAHVVVANCMPSRNVMWSGLYPHHSGVEGFYQVRDAKYPHLVDLMKGAGYFTAIRGKIPHSTPYTPYAWDAELESMPDGTKVHPKNAKSYGHSAAEGIRMAKAAGKPFCLLMNISDPHKPFYAEGNKGQTVPDPNVPSRVFTPDEVPVPGFLFDDPAVRKELSHYYSSVRRADDCFAEILAALRASGGETNTLVVFLSDHGMPLPFSKTQVYHDSSRTPLFFVWPGRLPEGRVVDRPMVSTVDLLPTLLDLLGIAHPGTMDGRSFAGLLRGGDGGREWVVKEYNENAGGFRNPMRAIESLEDLYIFNPWANGTRTMATATMGTPTYRRMAELAKTDPVIAARHDLFVHRVPEEFYAVGRDPACRTNLVSDPSSGDRLGRSRTWLETWMDDTDDPMLGTFRQRDDAAAREAFMSGQVAAADERKADKPKKGAKRAAVAAKAQAAKPRAAGMPATAAETIAFELPGEVEAGKPVTVRIRHDLPADRGEQVLTVTAKDGQGGERLDRKTVKAKGAGVAEVALDIPVGVDTAVSFAAFVGEDYKKTSRHITSRPVPVKQQ